MSEMIVCRVKSVYFITYFCFYENTKEFELNSVTKYFVFYETQQKKAETYSNIIVHLFIHFFVQI